MHYVFVPSPVTLVNLDTEEPMYEILDISQKDRATRTETMNGHEVYLAPDRPWSLWRWITRYVLGNKKLGPGDKGSKRAKRLRKAFKEAEPLTWVQVDSEIVDAIKSILDEPGIEWIAAITCQMTDFEDAWRNAVEGSQPEKPPSWYSPEAASPRGPVLYG